MSLFQCTKCGCVENSACTSCYASRFLVKGEVLVSYLEVLGMQHLKGLPPLCAACSPVWFLGDNYGIGPMPESAKGRTGRRARGMWHDTFPRCYLPKGQFVTSQEGNLIHKDTGKYDPALESDTEYN